jgi:hypothetical protein
MDKSQIIIISAILAFAGIKVYQKYIKKDKTKTGTENKSSSGMPFSSGSKEEDYEPYSKK